ncbi:tetratricopeptide repeat protein [Pelagibacteraceae bacterium]|nr:tetratricopeptide repeat protein [Pelagibacteraceae bacterium]
MDENKYDETKEILLDFISKNSNEIKAIKFYLECLLELKQYDDIDTFIESLDDKTKNEKEILQVIKKLELIRKNLSGPNINDLVIKLQKAPNDINLIIEVAEKYFSMQDYKNSMELLIKNYPKNKDRVKNKMIEFFEVLGNSNEYTISFRKKLSQIMFS